MRLDGLPIAIVTAEAQKEMMEPKAPGAQGWLVKPFDKAKLVAVVTKMIRAAQ